MREARLLALLAAAEAIGELVLELEALDPEALPAIEAAARASWHGAVFAEEDSELAARVRESIRRAR